MKMYKIGGICKGYRIKYGITLKAMGGEKHSTIQAFEEGRSTNIEHLAKYAQLAKNNGELYQFMNDVTVELVK